jgi:murein DD-endopeptidase MepM/ murein hydrolase activator NlpD
MQKPIFDITSFDPKTNKLRARLHPSARAAEQPWRWPLPKFGSRSPIVLAEHATGERRGVDLGYIVAPFDGDLFVPVYAAQSGEISFAMDASDGFAVTIDHGAWTTHYAHLSKMFVTPTVRKLRRRQHVRAGEVIGNAAKAPLHLRFEVWQRMFSGGFEAVDPIPHLDQWTITSPANEIRRSAAADQAA